MAEKYNNAEEYTSEQYEAALQKSVNAAENSAQRAAKKAKQKEKQARKAAQKSAKATRTAKEALINGARATVHSAKRTPWKLTGGFVILIVVIIIILLCGAMMGVCNSFAIMMTTDKVPITEITAEIEQEFIKKSEEMKSAFDADLVEITGEFPQWKEVLSVYAVKINLDVDSFSNQSKEELKTALSEILWDMTDISTKTKTETKTVIIEVVDKDGNVTQKEKEVEVKKLIVKVKAKTIDEIAVKYGFTKAQTDMVKTYSQEMNSLWSEVPVQG